MKTKLENATWTGLLIALLCVAIQAQPHGRFISFDVPGATSTAPTAEINLSQTKNGLDNWVHLRRFSGLRGDLNVSAVSAAPD
jgi:hypothetical protein